MQLGQQAGGDSLVNYTCWVKWCAGGRGGGAGGGERQAGIQTQRRKGGKTRQLHIALLHIAQLNAELNNVNVRSRFTDDPVSWHGAVVIGYVPKTGCHRIQYLDPGHDPAEVMPWTGGGWSLHVVHGWYIPMLCPTARLLRMRLHINVPDC